jgi:RNA polymerase sigma-70 factor (ECF subfamily)
MTGETKKHDGRLPHAERERIERYLPLNQQRAALFLNDWEDFVITGVRRMRVGDEEDVLYRVFDQALKGLPGFRGDSKISTWLYRITWRECVRSQEKTNRISRKEIALSELGTEISSDEDVSEMLERFETAARVRHALSKLGPLDREILALRYLEELKIGEVAQRLDLPFGTVKARTHRALGRLKTILEKHHDP